MRVEKGAVGVVCNFIEWFITCKLQVNIYAKKSFMQC